MKKYFHLLTVALILSLPFVSCGDDPDDEPTPVIPVEPVVPDDPDPTPPAHPNKILKNVTKSYSYSQGTTYQTNVCPFLKKVDSV